MNPAYQMFRVECAETAELAMQVIEDQHEEMTLHLWVEPTDLSRGEWLIKYSYFFALFADDVYRGYAAVVRAEGCHWLHFGAIRAGYAFKDVEYSMGWLKEHLPPIYGISSLNCCVDSGDIICKMVGKLGFVLEPDSADTYMIEL